MNDRPMSQPEYTAWLGLSDGESDAAYAVYCAGLANPHGIHCPLCTVAAPCASCQRQVDAEASWRSDRPSPEHVDGADLWDCPCRECTRLDHSACGGGHSLATHRRENHPEHYGPAAMRLPATHCPCRVSVYDTSPTRGYYGRAHDALCGCDEAVPVDGRPDAIVWRVPASYIRDGAHVVLEPAILGLTTTALVALVD